MAVVLHVRGRCLVREDVEVSAADHLCAIEAEALLATAG
jgi:hypothetical protein